MIRDKQRTVNLFTHLRLARPLLLTIAFSTLLLSYIAAFATIGAGDINFTSYDLFNVDSLDPWLTFQHAFLTDEFPLAGWRQGVALFYVPDYLILWSLFALGLDFRIAMLITPLLFAVLSIGGWIFTCDALFGKSWQRKIAIVFLHTLPYVFIAAGSVDLFGLQLQITFHYGTWTLAPWILGLFLRAIKCTANSRLCWTYLLIAMVLVIAATTSNLLIIFWLLVPMLIALMLTAWRGYLSYRATLPFWITNLGGITIGILIAKFANSLPDRNNENFLSFNFEKSTTAVTNIISSFAEAAHRAPIETVIWAIFTAIALRRCWNAIRLPDHDTAKDKNSNWWHALIKIPDSPVHFFLVFFVPLAAAMPIVATIATGNFLVLFPANVYYLGSASFRYFIPFIFLPLFIGWVLLPWDIKLARTALLLPAATIITLLLATIKLSVNIEGLTRLDPFAVPFQKCFAETASRLGWSGGIGNAHFGKLFITNPIANIKKFLPIVVSESPIPGQSTLYLDYLKSNRYWFDGEFQFVVANKFNDLWFEYPPPISGPPPWLLKGTRWHARSVFAFIGGPPPWLQTGRYAFNLFIDDTAIRGAFGEPTAIINCNGIGLYHYDPPLYFDFSNLPNPDFQQIGQRF